jgi:hypothetical protein
MRKTITLKLTPDLRARLEKYCEKNDRSASWVIKTLVDNGPFEPPVLIKFKGVSEKLTISVPFNCYSLICEQVQYWDVKLQDLIRTKIYHLTKGRKYK